MSHPPGQDTQTVHFANIHTLDPLQSANPSGATVVHPEQPPLTEPLYTYSDAAVHQETLEACIGWIVIDTHGSICAFGRDSIDSVSGPHCAESIALSRALDSTAELGADTVKAHLDAHFLVYEIRPEHDRTPSDEVTQHNIETVRDQLQSFELSQLSPIDRSQNAVAHRLAQSDLCETFDVVFHKN